MRRGGGCLLCCSFSVNRNGLLTYLSLPPSGVFCPLFFRFAFAVSLPFGLRLALFIAPVSGACFPAQGFLFLVVRGLSDCRLPLLFFSGCCPVLLCLFHFPWSCLFLWWPALPPPYVSPLGGPYFLSCGCLFFHSLPLAPVCCLLHFLPLSSLRWLCPTLVPGFQFLLVLFCFHFPSVLFSLFVFSPRCLLLLPSWAPLLGVQLPSLLVTRSEVSWPLVDILFGYWLHIFVVFFLLLCFSLCYSTSLLSTFSSLPVYFLG